MKTTALVVLLAMGCATEARPEALIQGGEPVVFDVGEPTATVDATCELDGEVTCLTLQERQGDGVWCYTDPDDGYAPRLDLDVADWSACEMCVVAMCDPNCCAYWAPAPCPSVAPPCMVGDHDCISPDAPRVCSGAGEWQAMTGAECSGSCPNLCPS